MPTSLPRARLLLLVLALGAYVNSLGNGFAYDDNWFIVGNPVVTEGMIAQAWTAPAWPDAPQGVGNYRPTTLTSFAVEWRLFNGAEFGFHLVSVLVHVGVTLLVFALLSAFAPLGPAWLGSALFAVHPVHVEAVANIMGRAELYAAAGYLGACLVFLKWRPQRSIQRGARLMIVLALFFLAAGSKEIAVTLPAALLALAIFASKGVDETKSRLREEGLLLVGVAAATLVYITVRALVLGTLTGEGAGPGVAGLSATERIFTALTIWPHYARLMFVPLDLSADYGPGVILPTTTMTLEVIVGGACLALVAMAAWRLRDRVPAAALGAAWFLITILPVSNLIVRADILLAERTLYLPSVGLALAVAGVADFVIGRLPPARLRMAGVAFAVVVLGFFVRTVVRNPTWSDTFSVVNTLANEHPESWLALRARAAGLERVGAVAEAAEVYDYALQFAPDHYQLLVDVAGFNHRLGNDEQAEELLVRAIAVLPEYPVAYVRLAEYRLLGGDGRAAHAAALAGLAAVGSHRGRWGIVSESYVAKGDLEAAARARRAALAQASDPVPELTRLAQILEQMGDSLGAAAVRDSALVSAPSTGGRR